MQFLLAILAANALVATFIAVFAWLLRRIDRGRPALAHAFFLLALVKLVAPPLFAVHLPLPTWPKSAASNREAPAEPLPVEFPAMDVSDVAFEGMRDVADPMPEVPAPAPEILSEATVARPRWLIVPKLDWSVWLATMIGVGAVCVWIVATIRIVRFERLLRNHASHAPHEWQTLVAAAASKIRLKRHPPVLAVPGRMPPLLWGGGGRARLIIPSQLFATLDPSARSTLIMHELAHFKRRDHWVRWLELFACGVSWWNPAAWWIRHSLRQTEEECCDAWVVASDPASSKVYARALLAALDFTSESPPLAGASTLGQRSDIPFLKRRFHMIMKADASNRLGRAGRLAVLAFSFVLLPLAPGWAQQDSARTNDSGDQPHERSAHSARDDARSDTHARTVPDDVLTDDLAEGDEPDELLDPDIRMRIRPRFNERGERHVEREFDREIAELRERIMDLEHARRSLLEEVARTESELRSALVQLDRMQDRANQFGESTRGRNVSRPVDPPARGPSSARPRRSVPHPETDNRERPGSVDRSPERQGEARARQGAGRMGGMMPGQTHQMERQMPMMMGGNPGAERPDQPDRAMMEAMMRMMQGMRANRSARGKMMGTGGPMGGPSNERPSESAQAAGTKPGTSAASAAAKPGTGRATTDEGKRLSELESKMDLLIKELHELKQQQTKTSPKR